MVLLHALLAGIAGYLIAAMFLSKTYFEIPYIYLGLLVAATGQLGARGPGGSVRRVRAISKK